MSESSSAIGTAVETAIETLPVFSKLATETLPPELERRRPAGWRLSEHQLETYQAVVGGQYDVVINTALTGDGKSLAGYLPALVNNDSLLALYPTNELARDQELQLESMRANWGARFRFSRISAALLEEMAHEAGMSYKRQALEQVFNNRSVVLSNPDIFHYIAQFYYTLRTDAPDRLFGRSLVDGFDQFIFDEFHVFDTPQVVSIVNALLLLRAVAGPGRKRFLFLSATPSELFIEYLRRGGFAVRAVATDGRYQHTDVAPDPAAWRLILRRAAINFAAQSAEEWVEAHLEDRLLRFFADNEGAKGAIIVNSVAAAHRLAARLKPVFREHELTVELNTGLSSETLRKASRESDLLIGTSTVDVGVDFRINLLIFESRDAATFLQRLGRLGRHEDDGRGHRFERFQAHALVPNFVLERLSPGHLRWGEQYTRDELAAAIRAVYPPPAQFYDYARQWGRFQSMQVIESLSSKTVWDTYLQTRRDLTQFYWKTFRISTNQAARMEFRAMRQEQPQLLDEARSFRGGSPLQCGLVNQTEPTQPILRYNLLSLAANADLTWLEREEFEAELDRCKLRERFSTEGLAAFFRLRGFAAQRRPLTILIDHRVAEWSAERLGQPIVLDRLRLEMDGVDWLNALNHTLPRRKLVVTLCLTPAQELRRRLYLPPLFELYDFRSADGHSGTIAFARQALLLHVALQQRGYDCGGGALIL